MKEIWKDIHGYEGIYQVSNLGKIKSISRKRFRFSGFILKERILKPGLSGNSYYTVSLWKNGKPRTYTIHKLIAKHFVVNNDNKPCINHINGIKTDNRIENLEWCTSKENNLHASNIGLRKDLKPIKQLQLNGKLIKKWDSSMQVQRAGIALGSCITAVLKRRKKTAGGFKWEYA